MSGNKLGFRANLSKLLFDDVIMSSSPPRECPGARKIWTPIFLDIVVHNEPKKAIKSISTKKSHWNTQYNTLFSIVSSFSVGVCVCVCVCVLLYQCE